MLTIVPIPVYLRKSITYEFSPFTSVHLCRWQHQTLGFQQFQQATERLSVDGVVGLMTLIELGLLN
jgi:hypothetical protein